MTPSSWQQQAFAMDARVNALRAAKHPNFRKCYSLKAIAIAFIMPLLDRYSISQKKESVIERKFC